MFVGKVIDKCDRRPRRYRTSGAPVKGYLGAARCGLGQVTGRRRHLSWVSKDREELGQVRECGHQRALDAAAFVMPPYPAGCLLWIIQTQHHIGD